MDETMPRRSKGPRLHWDKDRKQWVIRDGQRYKRIERGEGGPEQYAARAEKELRDYIGDKHQPQAGPDPLIVDVLLAYAKEVVPNLASAKNTAYNIDNLSKYWTALRVSDITSKRCREYAETRSRGGARRDLEVLRAALRYWNAERGLDRVPVVVLPDKGEPRERWLTRSEAARLLWAAWRYREVQKGHETDKHPRRHLARLILLCLYTGSRPGVILRLQWNQINFAGEYMLRRPVGVAEDKRKRTPRVRLARSILAHLRRWRRLDPEACRWVCHYEGVLARKVNKSFRNSVALAGLGSAVTPHTLRHTKATWMMQDGVDLQEAASFLGMTVQTLERVYWHHHPDFQKNAAERNAKRTGTGRTHRVRETDPKLIQSQESE